MTASRARHLTPLAQHGGDRARLARLPVRDERRADDADPSVRRPRRLEPTGARDAGALLHQLGDLCRHDAEGHHRGGHRKRVSRRGGEPRPGRPRQRCRVAAAVGRREPRKLCALPLDLLR